MADGAAGDVLDAIEGEPEAPKCPDCLEVMIISHGDLVCPKCGRMRVYEEQKSDVPNVNCVRLQLAYGRRCSYTLTSDQTKSQREAVYDFLLAKNRAASDDQRMPNYILHAVSVLYNDIQKASAKDGAPFIRRGDIKGEILAAILYYVGIREGIIRHKRRVANFLRLKSDGFSRGEDILRSLVAKGVLSIPQDNIIMSQYADYYCSVILASVDQAIIEEAREFVMEIMILAIKNHVCVQNQPVSKVVGAIWFFIVHRGLNVSPGSVEKLAGGVKKNTFMHLYNAIIRNRMVFGATLAKYKFAV